MAGSRSTKRATIGARGRSRDRGFSLMEMLVAISVFAGLAAMSVSVLARAADNYSRSRVALTDMRAAALLDRRFGALARAGHQESWYGHPSSETGAVPSDGDVAESNAVEASPWGDLLVRRNSAGTVLAARRLRASAERACQYDVIGRRCLASSAQ